MELMRLWINAIGFQLGWWACVLGVVHDLQGPAMACAVILIVAHLCTCRHAKEEAVLMGAVVLLGVVMDSALQTAGIITFHGWQVLGLSPVWLWLIWALFALTLNHSLAWLQKWPRGWTAALGAVLGPVSYGAGAQTGGADLQTSVSNLMWLALAWAVVTPMVVVWARRLGHDVRS